MKKNKQTTHNYLCPSCGEYHIFKIKEELVEGIQVVVCKGCQSVWWKKVKT